MATRIKKNLITAPDRTELPSLMQTIALSSARKKRIESELETSIARLRAKYQSEIDNLNIDIKEATDKLEAWASNNPSEFEKRRSLDLTHGMIGYRMGNWKVDYDRGIAKKAVDILKGLGLTQFVRTKDEVDKDAIIASKTDDEIMKKLKPVGIHVTQDETFFVAPKEEEYL